MNALLVVFAKVPEKHLEITIAADARRQYIDGDEFSGVASKFSDLSSTLRLSYKRLESNRVANKQKKAPHQGTLFPFINVRGGSK
jgi:nitrate/nitrite-specific signal transduction histidine kinase